MEKKNKLIRPVIGVFIFLLIITTVVAVRAINSNSDEFLAKLHPIIPPKSPAEQAAFDAQIKAAGLEAKADQAAWEASGAGKICAAHPGWANAICTSISKQQISLGMTKEQVTLAIGSPDNVNTTTTINGTREQWVYGYDYIYFEDGVLTSVQQHK